MNIMGILLQITETTTEVVDTVNQAVQNQAVVPTEEKLSFLNLAMKGGWIMIPLAILSVLAIYIFIERYLAINRAGKDDKNFMDNIKDFVSNGKVDSALALCKSRETPLAKMIEKGIKRIGRPLNDISSAIENVGKLEVSKLEKGVAILAMVAGAAPMIGFLGTVSGMIKAFYDMSKAGNNIDIGLLSGGIYEAMVTTLAGLLVGIIAYICYNIIVSRIEKVVYVMENKATEFMDMLYEPASK
jgi:biopolymer transport protein ExbB